MTRNRSYCNFVRDAILHRTKQQQIDLVMAIRIDRELCSRF
ncbi:unnamed protein product, partial [Onchocerca ochengi]|uniref:Transcriptional regulator n=1 Tax=Onchocerca ochengi TaxID=42157 RepID=A0A182EVR4_ONCOC